MHDVIVVGARCAGAPAAMLLARAGLDVVLVDRARFPSDTLSTHYIYPEGMSRLASWGRLQDLLDGSDTPLQKGLHLQFGVIPLSLDFEQIYPAGFPTRFAYAPRRTVLDAFLVNAARDAGVIVGEGFSVRDVLRDLDGRVNGVAGQAGDGRREELRARLVIGADGMHSRIARLVGAADIRRIDSGICAYYSYFSGMEQRSEITVVPGAVAITFPTSGGEQCVFTAAPIARFDEFRSGIDGAARALITEHAPGLAKRLATAGREARWAGSGDLPHFSRAACGPGWALAGDAALHVDPLRAFGMTKAFNDAEWLAEAVIAGFRTGDLDRQLACYARAHERAGEVYTERNLAWLRFALGQADESVLQMEGPLPLGSLAEWAA